MTNSASQAYRSSSGSWRSTVTPYFVQFGLLRVNSGLIGVGDEAPARHQVGVDAPEHAQQLVLARRVVEQIDRGDQIEGAQLGEGHGVAHLIRDAERLRLLLLVRQADHLRRDVDADHLRRAVLL